MADDLTNLLAANRSSSVLQGIANPPLVNPLAAMGSALSTARGVYELRGAQAKEAAGQAFLNSIDPATGKPNQALLMQNLRNDPTTAMAAQPAAEAGQTLDADTYKLHSTRLSRGADALGTLIGRFPNGIPMDAAHAAIDQEVATDLITPAQGQALKGQFGQDPRQNSVVATQLYSHNMSSAQNLERMYGTRENIPYGGGTLNTTIPPAGGPDVRVDQTPTPGERYNLTPSYIPLDAEGKPTTPDKAVRWQKTDIPRQGVGDMPPANAPPNVTRGTPGTPPAAIPPNPNVPPGTPPGRNSPLRNPAANPPAPTEPASPAPAAVPASPSTPGVITTPTGPAVVAAPPQGQEATLKANVDAYNADKAAVPTMVTRSQNLGHAYDALQVLKLNTGRGAEGISNIRSFLRTVGMLPPGTVKDADVMDIFGKYTERAMIEAAGGGGTDLARQMATQASPGKSLGTGANLEILRNDMGKALQNLAAHNSHDPTLAGAGYLDQRAKIASTTDPRGFVWNMYDADERKKILAEVAKDPAADAKLHRAIGMSLDSKLNLQAPVSRLPAIQPQKQSFFVPPPAPPAPGANALMIPA